MQSAFQNRHRGHVLIGIFGLVFVLCALVFGFMSAREPQSADRLWMALVVSGAMGAMGLIIAFVGFAGAGGRRSADEAAAAQLGANGSRWLEGAGVVLITAAFVVIFFYPVVKTIYFRPKAPPLAQSKPAVPPMARKDASNVDRGFRAQYIKVVGEEFAAEVHGADLRLRIGSLRLESTGKLPEANYYNLGVYVQQHGRKVGQVDDGEIRGTLAAGAPAVTIRDRTFVIRGAGAACQQGGCEARLVLAVQTSANSAYGENTDFATIQIRQAQDIAAVAAEPSKYWDSYFGRAQQAANEGRLDEALRLYDETLAVLRRSNGANHPLEALVLFRSANAYGQQKDFARQEQTLLRAMQVLEPRSAAEIKSAVGVNAWFDNEMLAREIGDFYWEQRRYADAHGYYLKAWEAAPGLDTTEYSRNLKRAFSSAGVMVTACTLGKWDLADSAMAELKERYPKVEPESQRKLKYWIDTGEPRLKARKC
jgi:tetratricopeptide (TPR) repeat protein